MKKVFVLLPAPHPARQLARMALEAAPDGMVVTIQEPTRSLATNALFQCLIREFAKKAGPVMVNNELTTLDADDWRPILVSAFKKETGRLVEFDGSLIMLGGRTRDMGKKEASEFVEFIHAAAAQRGFRLTKIESDGCGAPR